MLSVAEFLIQTVWFQRSIFLYEKVFELQAASVISVTLFDSFY